MRVRIHRLGGIIMTCAEWCVYHGGMAFILTEVDIAHRRTYAWNRSEEQEMCIARSLKLSSISSASDQDPSSTARQLMGKRIPTRTYH